MVFTRSSNSTQPSSYATSGSDYSGGSRRSRRLAQKPVGYFSEQSQQERNETLRKQLEEELPSRLGKRGRAGSLSNGSRSKKPRQLPKLPEQEPLDIETFLDDLSNDYTDEWEANRPRPKLAAKKMVWKRVKTPPVGQPVNPPKGWSEDEADLDPEDFPAQIARCKERIREGLMVHVYEIKLGGLLELRRQQFELMAETPGVSLDVAHRLKTLEGMLASLVNEGDKFNLIESIENIIVAYKSGVLKWTPGLVTYWNDGYQLCQPRPFDWREFRYLHDENDGLNTGFHTEGLFGPNPTSQNPSYLEYKTFPFDNHKSSWQDFIEMKISLRIPLAPPGLAQWTDLSFIDDTGANIMQIYSSDVKNLMESNPHTSQGNYPMPRCLGIVSLSNADGTSNSLVVRELEVNIWDRSKGCFMGQWESVPAVIRPGDSMVGGRPLPRLNGPWARWRYYTATVPNVKKLGVYDYNPTKPPPGFQSIADAPPPAPYVSQGWHLEPTEDHNVDLNLPAGR